MSSLTDIAMAKLREIIYKRPYTNKATNPIHLVDRLFVGDYDSAFNIEALNDLGITHVLNCAGYGSMADVIYDKDSHIEFYKEFVTADNENYDMLQHVNEAVEFIDEAQAYDQREGRVLVHCAMGHNRSVMICIAYIMLKKRWSLFTTTELLKSKVGTILSNKNFQKQLVYLARVNNLLLV